jgi:hypothetical protein
MNAKAKSILVIALKQGVNAILTNGAIMALLPDTFHVHSWQGISHILELTGSVVLSREAMIWAPKLLEWSQSQEPEPKP